MNSAAYSNATHRRKFLQSARLVPLSDAVSTEAADADESRVEGKIHLTGAEQQDRRIAINGQKARTLPITATGEQVLRIELADASQ